MNSDISLIIKSLFPGYLQDDGQQLLSDFLEAYYNWSTRSEDLTTGEKRGPLEFITNLLKYRDLDKDPVLHDAEFIQYNVNNIVSLLPSIPDNGDLDVTTLTKNLKDFLISKGSVQSIKFLFNSFFELPSVGTRDTEVRYGRDYVLRTNSKSKQPEINETIITVAAADWTTIKAKLDNPDLQVKVVQYNSRTKALARWTYIDSYRVLSQGATVKVAVFSTGSHFNADLLGDGVSSYLVSDNTQYDFMEVNTNSLGIMIGKIPTDANINSLVVFSLPSYSNYTTFNVFDGVISNLAANSKYGVLYKTTYSTTVKVERIISDLKFDGHRFARVGDQVYANGVVVGAVSAVKRTPLSKIQVIYGGSNFQVGDKFKSETGGFEAEVKTLSSGAIQTMTILNRGSGFSEPQRLKLYADASGNSVSYGAVSRVEPIIVAYADDLGEVTKVTLNDVLSETNYTFKLPLRCMVGSYNPGSGFISSAFKFSPGNKVNVSYLSTWLINMTAADATVLDVNHNLSMITLLPSANTRDDQMLELYSLGTIKAYLGASLTGDTATIIVPSNANAQRVVLPSITYVSGSEYSTPDSVNKILPGMILNTPTSPASAASGTVVRSVELNSGVYKIRQFPVATGSTTATTSVNKVGTTDSLIANYIGTFSTTNGSATIVTLDTFHEIEIGSIVYGNGITAGTYVKDITKTISNTYNVVLSGNCTVTNANALIAFSYSKPSNKSFWALEAPGITAGMKVLADGIPSGTKVVSTYFGDRATYLTSSAPTWTTTPEVSYARTTFADTTGSFVYGKITLDKDILDPLTPTFYAVFSHKYAAKVTGSKNLALPYKKRGVLNNVDSKLTGLFTHDFAYTIVTDVPKAKWDRTIRNLTHPAGYAVYGEQKLVSRGFLKYQVQQLIQSTSSSMYAKMPARTFPVVYKSLGWINANALSNGSASKEKIALDENGSRLLLNNTSTDTLISGRTVTLSLGISIRDLFKIKLSSMVGSSVLYQTKLLSEVIKG